MPSDDYNTASRGALKIKGVQGAKVEKSKKKKKKAKDADDSKSTDQKSLADALADEDGEDGEDKELAGPGSNMTEAERQSYERRYKRVCLLFVSSSQPLILVAGREAQEGRCQVSQRASREFESIFKLTQ